VFNRSYSVAEHHLFITAFWARHGNSLFSFRGIDLRNGLHSDSTLTSPSHNALHVPQRTKTGTRKTTARAMGSGCYALFKSSRMRVRMRIFNRMRVQTEL